MQKQLRNLSDEIFIYLASNVHICTSPCYIIHMQYIYLDFDFYVYTNYLFSHKLFI